jgi:RNase P subunit RPR2
MFTICPDCGNDKLKVKARDRMIYDPATTRVTVEEQVPVVEYHCHDCGWTVLVEDPADGVPQFERDMQEARAGRETGVRREKGQ